MIQTRHPNTSRTQSAKSFETWTGTWEGKLISKAKMPQNILDELVM
jgi:hypothetical protein